MTLYDLEYKIKNAARWKLIAAAALLLCVAIYLLWSVVHKDPPAAGTIVQPPPAILAQKEEGPAMRAPLRIVPPAAVAKKFPQLGRPAANNPVIDTAKIPAVENGGATVTFMNITTGIASTVFIPAAAPWFALEDKNAVGVAYLQTTSGPAGAAYYRRDLFRIKDFHVSGVAAATTVGGQAAAGAGILGEVRF